MEGLKEWLDAVSTARIPCAVVSSLDRRIMVEILENMGLMKYFQVCMSFGLLSYEPLVVLNDQDDLVHALVGNCNWGRWHGFHGS